MNLGFSFEEDDNDSESLPQGKVAKRQEIRAYLNSANFQFQSETFDIPKGCHANLALLKE